MSGYLAPLPIIMTAAGLQPQPPASLRAQLLAAVTATNPFYTANLPGSLIEDVASTDTFAVALCDSALVELVNSLTPYGANEFLLNQLGQQYGLPPSTQPSNTSVYVVIAGVPQGYVIAPGFTVSDGSNQYVVQDGGIASAGGSTLPIFCLASQPGSFAVPAGTVTTIATSVPASVSASIVVSNPEPGTPGAGVETSAQYRARVLEGILGSAQGTPAYLKAQLKAIPGVQARLVALRQVIGSVPGWQVLCAGGDPYQVAGVIYRCVPDVSVLLGSQVDPARTITTSISDFPDSYQVLFVNPPPQTVEINLTWNTSATNFVSGTAVASLGQAAIIAYINSIPAGQPINVFELNSVFQQAIAGIVATPLLTRMVFAVSINGVGVFPSPGTGLIAGDAESYFETDITHVQVVQG